MTAGGQTGCARVIHTLYQIAGGFEYQARHASCPADKQDAVFMHCPNASLLRSRSASFILYPSFTHMLCCFIIQAVPLLDGPRTAPLAAGLLYQLSLDDEARSAFCFCSGALNRLLDSILRALGPSQSGGRRLCAGCTWRPGLHVARKQISHSGYWLGRCSTVAYRQLCCILQRYAMSLSMIT